MTKASQVLKNSNLKNPSFESFNFNIEIQELYNEPAHILCTEFYEKHYGKTIDNTQAVYVAHGGQSAVYRCFCKVRDCEIFINERPNPEKTENPRAVQIVKTGWSIRVKVYCPKVHNDPVCHSVWRV